MSICGIGRPSYFGLTLTLLWSIIAASAQSDNPDALYRNRENFQSAGRAADLWEARASTDFEAAWKLARIAYWIGTHGPEPGRRATLERGIKAGESSIQLAPDKPEGHFWVAANMGALAESFGLGQGLKYRGRIKEELERAIAINPRWEGGAAEDALGRWYMKVPGLFGGSDEKAEEHLRRALAINPDSRMALSDLADLLIAHDRTDEARPLLRHVVGLPVDPEWAPEDRELAAQAAARLRKLQD
jgi:tetratricopeptide (TPR) repeat protein